METDMYKLQQRELREIVVTAIRVAEEACYEAYKEKRATNELGMQRYVFQESFRMVLSHLLATRKPKGNTTSEPQFEPISEPFHMTEPF